MTTPSLASRRKAERRGRFAETFAALWLMAKGYRIVARRARTPFGEIDLAALKGGVLAVVEVKARPTLDGGLYAIGPRQRGRLLRAGADLARRLRLPGDAPIRFDVVVVQPWRWPAHLRSAFREDDAAG
ncbi:MAG: YraN family protein [Hyphomonadaceae bacterium]